MNKTKNRTQRTKTKFIFKNSLKTQSVKRDKKLLWFSFNVEHEKETSL